MGFYSNHIQLALHVTWKQEGKVLVAGTVVEIKPSQVSRDNEVAEYQSNSREMVAAGSKYFGQSTGETGFG